MMMLVLSLIILIVDNTPHYPSLSLTLPLTTNNSMVRVAQNKKTGQRVAVKCIMKHEVLRERRLLSEVRKRQEDKKRDTLVGGLGG
jgi:hypothetical protein